MSLLDPSRARLAVLPAEVVVQDDLAQHPGQVVGGGEYEGMVRDELLYLSERFVMVGIPMDRLSSELTPYPMSPSAI